MRRLIKVEKRSAKKAKNKAHCDEQCALSKQANKYLTIIFAQYCLLDF